MISSLKTKMDIFVPFYAFIRINWRDRPRVSWWRHSGAWEQQELVKTLPGCSSTHLKGDFRCHGEPVRDDRFLLSRSSFPHVQLHAAASGQKNLPVHLHRGAACQLARWNTENKKRYGGLKYKATLHIVSYSKRFFCAGWLNQKVVNKELLGSVSLWRTIIAHGVELCVFPRHLNVLSFTFSAVQISCELNEYISIDYVNNNPLTPAEYLTFLSLFPVERNADCTNLLMQSNESAAGS